MAGVWKLRVLACCHYSLEGDHMPADLRRRRREATTGEILRAARELFAEQGYAATRTNEIAARARVSDATLFRYFSSKPSIALAGLSSLIDGMVEQLASEPAELTAVEAARAVLAEVLRQRPLDRNDPVVAEIIMVTEVPELRPSLDAMINAAADATARALARRRGDPEPGLRDRVEAHMIIGAIQAATEVGLQNPGVRLPGDLIDEALRMLSEPDR